MKKEMTCPVCGISYQAELRRLKFGRQTTCSRACSYLLRADNLTKKTRFACATCGKDFYRAPASVKGKYNSQFCSRACHYSGRSKGLSGRVVLKPYNITEEGRAGWLKGAKKTREIRIRRDNYRHTELTKAKLSIAAAKAISEGRVPVRSRLEDKVGEYMLGIGVDFIAQYMVRAKNGRIACCFDFFFPDRKIALEVNGTFWHSDIRFYPDGPIHEIQKRNAIKWENKLAIAKSLGIEIREAWEHDIGINLPEAVAAAIR